MSKTVYGDQNYEGLQQAKSELYAIQRPCDNAIHRDGGVQDRLHASVSMLSQLHEEISILEKELAPLLAPRPEGGCSNKPGPNPPRSQLADRIDEHASSLGSACERLRSLRMGLDL